MCSSVSAVSEKTVSLILSALSDKKLQQVGNLFHLKMRSSSSPALVLSGEALCGAASMISCQDAVAIFSQEAQALENVERS